MKTTTALKTLLPFIALGLSLTASAQSGGSLTPPAGAPGKTMKSLDEVEPRRPLIAGVSGVIETEPGVYRITSPGSYYLTQSFGVPSGKTGISIEAFDVTLDLNGFVISSAISTAANHDLISCTGKSNIRIINGTLVGASVAINLETCQSFIIQNMLIRSSGFSGLYLKSCKVGQVTQCTLELSDSQSSILLSGTSGVHISHCNIYKSSAIGAGITVNGSNGKSSGNTIKNCNIQGGSWGIITSSSNLGDECSSNMIKHNTISNTGAEGIYFLANGSGGTNGNIVSHNTVHNCGGIGIYLLANSSTNNKCNGNTVAHNTINNTGSYGIRLNGSAGPCEGNRVVHNTITNSQTNGMWLSSANRNQVDSNLVANTKPRSSDNESWGIETSGTSTGNLITRNTCLGQTNNFDLNSNDTAGPIVTSSGTLSTTGAAAHPWANFSR